MVHPNNIVADDLEVSEEVNIGKEPVNDVKTMTVVVDVRQQFTNDMSFASREHFLNWIQSAATKLGFGIVILRSNYGSSNWKAFVMLNCERGGKYVPTNRVLKHENMGSGKCGSPFRLRVTYMIDDLWHFSVICGLHNHALETKLHMHPIACRLSRKEKNVISNLSTIKVAQRNILADLKQKKNG
ncbi:uncharacterized protein LOC131627885 [Vicia villosa]|uniref:uncharacterized protein LOC131627885 n=1 Tax=Vicia villosa TaxID=3911 RepID=UPI00273C0F54|nr:uncharacterized protein LOC131627885 [Vicia villosa]